MADNDNTKMSADDAYSHLLGNVYVTTFMSKLAANGIVPANDTEYQNLLFLADSLRGVTSEKQATSRFSDAVEALAEYTANSPLSHTAQETAIKQAAASFVSDPKIYQAVMTLLANDQAALAGAK